MGGGSNATPPTGISPSASGRGYGARVDSDKQQNSDRPDRFGTLLLNMLIVCVCANICSVRPNLPQSEAAMTGDESLQALFGRRVATARRNAHQTQAEVAKRSGISIRTLAMVEHGTTDASLGTVIAIGMALNLKIGYALMTDEEDYALLALAATLSKTERVRLVAVARAMFGPIAET